MRLIAVLTFLSACFAIPYDTVFAFGDSYSAVCGRTAYISDYDCPTWNTFPMREPLKSDILPASPPGKGFNWLGWFTGCYSNDPFECNTRLFDLAYEGASIGGSEQGKHDGPLSIYDQCQQFELYMDKQLRWNVSSTVFSFFGGLSDVVHLYEEGPSEDTRIQWVDAKVIDYFDSVNQIFEAGGRHFIVFNVPDFSTSPSSIAGNQNYAPSVDLFNKALAQRVKTFRKEVKTRLRKKEEFELFYIDVNTLFKKILNNLEEYEITNIHEECYYTSDCHRSHFWWDARQAGERVHELISHQVRSQIDDRFFPDPFRRRDKHIIWGLTLPYVEALVIACYIVVYSVYRRCHRLRR